MSDYNNEEYSSSEVVEVGAAFTKKQIKIQKKIDTYNREIELLYIKQNEWVNKRNSFTDGTLN